MTMKAAVVGVGNMGRHHARIYFELPNTELVAISDINEKIGRETAAKYKCNYYNNYLEMLEKESLDIVSIAVPTKIHKEVTLNCLKNVKNILLEKPIADNLEDAKEIIEMAEVNKVRLMIGHLERFNPVVLKLREIVQSNELGDIITVVSRRVGLPTPQIKDASVIIDLAIHDLDIFNFIFKKKPTKIFPLIGNKISSTKEDHADILLKFDNFNAFLQVNWLTPVKIRSLSITGSKGYAEINYITQELKLYKNNTAIEYDSFGDFVIKFGNPLELDIHIVKDEPLKNEIRSFVESIEKNKEVPIPLQDTLEALELALKIQGLNGN